MSALVAPRPARGEAVGYQLNHYEPTPAGDPFLLVEAPWSAATRWFAAGLTFDYAYNLLVAERRDATATSPIAHATSGHLDLAGALFDRITLSLSVPVVIDQAGTAFAGVGPTGTTAGDPRVGVRARLYGRPDGPVSLSASAYLWIPIGAADRLTGDASVRGLGRLTVGGIARDRVRWAINTSLLARETAVLSPTVAPEGNTVGSEVQLAAAVGYLALDRRLSLGPEAVATIALADVPASQGIATLEVLGSARYGISDRVQLGLGVGTSVAGSGPPDARVLLSLTYAPARPRGPTSSFERVVVLPDEDGHVGAVEVSDGKRTQLLDRAYASTELRKRDGKIQAVQSSPAKVAQGAASLERALPPSDRDGDGFIDAEDGCPERAGTASPDPIRRGCPPAAEKVVVLPDDDGHVGGVEIDDGKTKTVLDQAYASAEVDVGGTARVVPSPTPRAIAHATQGVAQVLPPADADDDGILDHEDACPARPGVRSLDPIRHGCPSAAERIVVLPDPDGHVGGVEVDDGHGTTLVDQAYASVEVGRDGVAKAVAPTPARATEHAIAAIAKSLPLADSDQDGTRDEEDACPERAGPTSPDPLRSGCPLAAEKVVVLPDADGKVGAVEIDDGKHTVLLDTAYATAEVSGGQVSPAPTTGAALATRATAAIARSLPPPDRDDDGIVDADDACPTRPGLASSDPTQQGCPRRMEQVVVLADENGTVGAVEVDDGTTKIVLDQAYASAEIGADGLGRALPAEATAVSARYGAAMAARPPGARIILYFTARSEPARDLTGPIDNLVAEVKAKTTYTIEVIGHTDQTGSERANVRIGRERAQLIADRLTAAGVPADRIKVSSKGSSEPAVKRASRRVVELRNRRVEIWMR